MPSTMAWLKKHVFEHSLKAVGLLINNKLLEKDIVKALQDATRLARGFRRQKRRVSSLAGIKPAVDKYVTPL